MTGDDRAAPEVRLVGSSLPAPAPQPPGERPPDEPPARRRLLGGGLALAAAVVVVLAVQDGGSVPPTPTPAPSPTASMATAVPVLYLASCDPDTLYRVRADGALVRLTGTPAAGSEVRGGGPVPATRSDCPDGLAFDAAGVLRVVGPAAERVDVVGGDGLVRPLILTAPATPPAALGLRALLVSPEAVACGRDGTVYVGTPTATRVRRLAAGVLAPLDPTAGPPTAVDDPARPAQIAVDDALSAYFADSGSNSVYKADARGRVTTLAGTGTAGSSGDGGPAVRAELDDPRAVAIDAQGRLYVSEGNGRRVRRIDADGTIHTVAGTGAEGASGDGGPATAATFRYPGDLAVDTDGSVYVVDLRAGAVRRIDPHGTIGTVGT